MLDLPLIRCVSLRNAALQRGLIPYVALLGVGCWLAGCNSGRIGSPPTGEAWSPVQSLAGSGAGGPAPAGAGAGAAGVAGVGGAAGMPLQMPPEAGSGGAPVAPMHTVLHGHFGSWCGPADAPTRWLVLQPSEATSCEGQAAWLNEPPDGTALVLPLQVDGTFTPGSSVASSGQACGPNGCSDVSIQLDVSQADGSGVAGEWSLVSGQLPEALTESGTFDAAPCSWDDHLPAHPDAPPLASGLRLDEVALYQAVKVPLMQDMRPVSGRDTDVVAGRDAWVRAFVAPEAGWSPREIRARLELTHPGADPEVIEVTRRVEGASSDGVWSSTFNFEVPAEAITPQTELAVSLHETGACPSFTGTTQDARYPLDGDAAPLDARQGHPLKLTLVPIRYDGRVPDTSETAIAAYRGLLEAMFPITEVDLTVREAQEWSSSVQANGTGWDSLLQSVATLRQQDGAPADVHYYGLINPAASSAVYCSAGCVAGVAFQADQFRSEFRAGVGIGYMDEGGRGIGAVGTTFAAAHEIAHTLGRGHVACDAFEGVDRGYPHPVAEIGTWGFDRRSEELFAPDARSDLMGYCRPQWISDYTYQGLLERLAIEQQGRALVLGDATPTTWQTLLVGADGNARWGSPMTLRSTVGLEPRALSVLDGDGAVIERVEAYEVAMSDGLGSMWLLPERKPGCRGIVLPDGSSVPVQDAAAPQLAP